ncbi:MAG: zinc-dependent peptidase [Chitinophagaceae bacterium]|nr:zinc-dependent peptidase [Chitinophagaceae bacterium]
MNIIILIALVVVIVYWFIHQRRIATQAPNPPPNPIPIENLLREHIPFYHKLNAEHKNSFQQRVMHFLQHTRFTNVGAARHTLLDEVYIASAAIIPLFAFPDWEYRNIREILLYEGNFDHDYTVDGHSNPIMGMVGDGALNGTMLLSLDALRDGFARKDGSNTAIHEFVHLIDKADGSVDGVPEYLIPKSLIAPWLKHIRASIQDIHEGDSDINPYGATNEAEFLAVISEYFFEKPDKFNEEHPHLYRMMNDIFSHRPQKATD